MSDDLLQECKNIWWEINATDKKLAWLIGVGLWIAVVQLASVIHHW